MRNISSLSNFTASPPLTCEASNVVGMVLLIPLPIIAALINMAVALAATVYRKNLLRQNAVYMCVISTLMSNLGTLGLHLWEIIASIMAISNNDVTIHDNTDLTLWVLCQAAAFSMLFVMCWNLCALIYVMLDTTYFHSAARIAKNGSEQSAVKLLASKRWKTALLISFSWLVPIAFTIGGVVTWNCADVCDCSFGAAGVACPKDDGCSSVWPPLKISFLAVQGGLWLLEIFCLIGFVLNGINEYVNFVGLSRKGLTNQRAAPDHREKEVTLPVSQENETGFHRNVKKKKIPSWGNWNPRLKLAAVLSFLFILTTAVPAFVLLLDILRMPHNIQVSHALSSVFIYIYTLLCPILMTKYMPNLRRALLRLFTTLLFCLK